MISRNIILIQPLSDPDQEKGRKPQVTCSPALISNEADGIRTRNHRIDSPYVAL